jgi:hypothetical protein
MRNRLTLFLIILACPLISTNAPGRILEDWPYERLMKEADLVVLVTTVKTEPAGERFNHDLWPLELVGQNTTLNVKLALKGDAPREITVLHFKFGAPKEGVTANEASVIFNGPMFVTFQSNYVANVKGVNLPPPEYLLFLRRLNDGRYEPVSGRIDPALSVRELFERGSQREVNWRKQPEAE